MSKDLSADGVAPEEWKPLHPLTYLPRVLGSVTGIIGAVTLANASALAAWLSGETPAGTGGGVGSLAGGSLCICVLICLHQLLRWRLINAGMPGCWGSRSMLGSHAAVWRTIKQKMWRMT